MQLRDEPPVVCSALPRQWMIPGGLLIATAVGLFCLFRGVAPAACWCAGTAVLCAAWWISECVPMAATAMIPIAVFPLVGVLSHSQAAAAYGDTMILLLMGGAFISVAMEASGAHRRIAIGLIHAVGGQGGRSLILGFMIATAALSMWISNTATTLMMLPIALAVLAQKDCGESIRTPLLLGIAFAASIGGMATPVGTPANIIFIGQYEKITNTLYTFPQWMMIGIPITCVLVPLVWWWLTRHMPPSQPMEIPKQDRWKESERRVLFVFALTALAWIFRESPGGGWTALIGATNRDGKSMVSDSTIAIFTMVLLFIIPTGDRDGQRLLHWEMAVHRIPWGVLLLFSGGLALAAGFSTSGLSEVIGSKLTFLAELPTWAIILSICVIVTFLTEITSSTATTAMLLPILGATAMSLEIEPSLLMVPATISASCAFMLPVATAPNAIVFSAGGIRTDEMARQGFALNLLAAVIITGFCWLLL